jgi:rhamnosyltransferase
VSAVTSPSTFSPKFGLVVPTYNPGLEAWTQWVQAVQFQNCKPMQVVVVDSGSSDGSLALSKQAGFTVLHTQAKDFNHGATRQWALNQAFLNAEPKSEPNSESNSEPNVIVFLTQDLSLIHI